MKVKVLPTQQELEVTSQKSLLQICTDNRIEIKSLCKGKPSCAECRIKITNGEDSVNPPSQTELSLIGSNYFLDGRRLSCQVYCFGDITIDITEQLERGDSSAKKIRGFRGQTKSAQESQAKRDTFILGDEGRSAENLVEGNFEDADNASTATAPTAAKEPNDNGNRSRRERPRGGGGGNNQSNRSRGGRNRR